MIIRKGNKNDMPAVLDLIKQLAVFENEPDAVVITSEDLVRDGFGENPLFHTFVAEVNDEIFNLAADIFGSLTKEANGDPQKVKKILEEAQRNPEEFAKKLSASEKKKLHSISQKMPSN